jgi:hypothetical protein
VTAKDSISALAVALRNVARNGCRGSPHLPRQLETVRGGQGVRELMRSDSQVHGSLPGIKIAIQPHCLNHGVFTFSDPTGLPASQFPKLFAATC